ncbi:Hsp20/alpha crystallin family protein [Patescibacteria group bacterium]|nr:Hsp20/alpha crystallin family protein [Patescibacteria group bacterium]
MTRWLMPWFSHDELDKFFDEPFMTRGHSWMNAPVVDVYEKGDSVVIQFEVPGVEEKDLDVEITDKLVIVKGEVKEKKEIKDKKYYRMESRMGSFTRQVAWPTVVDYKKAVAEMEDGVLSVVAPKIGMEKKSTKLKVKKIGKKDK